MLKFPDIPQWDALHPLIVHFPVALLLTVPLFIFLGLAWKKYRQCLFIMSFILLLLGTAAVFLAVETGEAAGELVEKSAAISQVLKDHSQLAETTRLVFSILTIIYAGILFLPNLFVKGSKGMPEKPAEVSPPTILPDAAPLWQRIMVIVFLVIYLVSALILVNTASYGGRLVHQLGVHALL